MGIRDDSHDPIVIPGDADPRLVENLRLTQKIAALEVALAEARREYEGPMAEEIQVLKGRVAALERELAELRSEHADAVYDNSYLRKALDDAHAAIRALDDALNELVANDFVAAWISQQIADVQEKHAPAIRRATGGK